MRTLVDDRLRREAARFALRHTCEHCAHFEPSRAVCAEGYPNEAHRDAGLDGREALLFCKSFELC